MNRWRQNPQRVAWVILSASFFLCCLLTVAVPLWARSTVLRATRARVVHVTAVSGTLQLQGPNADDPTAVTDRRTVAEGSSIITDDTARAVLTVSADRMGQDVLITMQLFQNTAVRLEQARTRRFPYGHEPDRVVLAVQRGRVAVETTASETYSATVQISTPGADVSFGSGAFFVTVEGAETQVVARYGAAQVAAAGTQVTATSGQRISVTAGRAPEQPVSSTRNLLENGTFDAGLSRKWQILSRVEPGLAPGQVLLETTGQRRAVRFLRRAEDGAPNEIGIRQVLEADVLGYDSLQMRFDVQLLYQSVPGGGYLSSEYPMMVDVHYSDVYGKDLHWYQGFYYLDLPPGSTYRPPVAEKLPIGVWYTYESPDLMQLLAETRPARIHSVTLSASGHDYESRVADLALMIR